MRLAGGPSGVAEDEIARGRARTALGTARRSRYIQASPWTRKAPGSAPARRHGDARRGRSDPHHRRTGTEAGPGEQRLTADRRRMKARTLGIVSLLALVVALLAAGCGGGGDGGSQGTGEDGAQQGGILRLGTTNYIDSLNPFNYIEAQAYNAFIMIYPQLVQYKYENGKYEFEGDWATSWETSKDGKIWTFTLHEGTKWSDGEPLTAEDAAWTINTTVKFADGPTAVAASALNFVKEARAPDPTTLEIEYETPIGNTLAQLEQFFVLPKHVYEPLAVGNGKGLKTFHPEQNLPMVSAGAYTIKEYEKKGTTVYIPDPNFWGPKSNAEAVAMTFYTNSDSMINDLKQGTLDWVDQVPWGAVDVLKEDANIVVEEAPGRRDHEHHVELEPAQADEPRAPRPGASRRRSRCASTARRSSRSSSRATPTRSSPSSGTSHRSRTRTSGPLEHNCAEGNRMLDELGYERGPDGIRIAPATTGEFAQEAHPMRYRIMQPTSLDFNGPALVRRRPGRLRRGGRRRRALDRRRCDRGVRDRDRRSMRSGQEPGLRQVRHRHVGLGRLRRPGLHALRLDQGPVVLVERHGLRQPRVRPALRGAGQGCRSPGAGAGSSTRCSRSSTTTSSTRSSRTTSPWTPTERSGTGSTCRSRATRRRTTQRRTRWARCGSANRA